MRDLGRSIGSMRFTIELHLLNGLRSTHVDALLSTALMHVGARGFVELLSHGSIPYQQECQTIYTNTSEKHINNECMN